MQRPTALLCARVSLCSCLMHTPPFLRDGRECSVIRKFLTREGVRVCQFPLTQRGYVVEACTGCVSSPSHGGRGYMVPTQKTGQRALLSGNSPPRKRRKGFTGERTDWDNFALLPSISHGKGHFLPTEENIMYLKKERSILLGAGPQIVSL